MVNSFENIIKECLGFCDLSLISIPSSQDLPPTFGQKIWNLLLTELAHSFQVVIVPQEGDHVFSKDVGVGVGSIARLVRWKSGRDVEASRVLDALDDPRLERWRVLLCEEHHLAPHLPDNSIWHKRIAWVKV